MSLADELKQFLKGVFSDAGTDVVKQYSKPEDFIALWETPPDLKIKRVVIVWDGFPRGDERDAKLLNPHVTPLDWAIWVAGKQNIFFELDIIDLTNAEYINSFGVKYRHQVLASMPFIKIYAVLGLDLPQRKGYLLLSALLTKKLVPTSDATSSDITSDYQHTAHTLYELWRATLQRISDHHDLNNIVGPLITTIFIKNGDKLRSAISLPFNKLALGLKIPLIEPESDENGLSFCFGTDIEKFGFIDDFDGWPRLISPSTKHVVGFDLCSDDDLCGLSKIIAEFTLEKMQTRHFDLPPWPSDPPDSFKPEGLIIDLRLFTASKQSQLNALLIEAAIKIQTCKTLAWDTITDKEIFGANIGAEAVLHSLLPRLCALRWPTLPIIILTASAQRAVLDKLRPYGNIIIGPRKPDLMVGNPKEALEGFIAEFSGALGSALQFASMAASLRSLQETAKSDVAAACPQINHKHFVLAFDEYGNFRDIPSGIQFALLESSGPSKREAIDISCKFQEHLRQGGAQLRYPPFYLAAKRGGVPSAVARAKGATDAFNAQIAGALNTYKETAIQYFAVKASKAGAGLVSSRYLTTLCSALEFALCEIVERCNTTSKSIEIWFPNRLMVEYSANEAQQLDVLVINNHAQFAGQGNGLQILARALEQRIAPNYLHNSLHIRLAKICYANDAGQAGMNWRTNAGPEIYWNKQQTITLDTQNFSASIRGTPAFAVYSPVAHLADEAFNAADEGKYIGPAHVNILSNAVIEYLELLNLLDTGRALVRDDTKGALAAWSDVEKSKLLPNLAKIRVARGLVKAIRTCRGSDLLFNL